MSTNKNDKLLNKKDGIVVYGYVRDNFDKRCWIDQIIVAIIKFFMIKSGSLYIMGDAGLKMDHCITCDDEICKKLALCPPFNDNNAYKVSVGLSHTLIVDTDGDVWGFGRGDCGQLGNGKRDYFLYIPTKLSLNARIIAVSAGNDHSLFLCENGTVKGCGDNECGQIGLGDLEETLVPKTIKKLVNYKIVQIKTGDQLSAVLTEDGDLFCFGDNRYGQCGVGREKGEYIKTPTKVDFDDEIEFVDCSYHVLIISSKGLIHSVGYGEYGELGHGGSDHKYVPALIDSMKGNKIKMCAAGEVHSLCIDKEGIIWSFGCNWSGQCGLSRDIDKQTTPKVISWFIKNNIKGKECSAGSSTSSIIATDESLYFFGDHDDYQLGLEKKTYYTPLKLPFFDNMTVHGISLGKKSKSQIAIIATK